MLHAPVEAVERQGVPCFVQRVVYLDGPALTPEVQVAADILDWEPPVPADFFMIVDGRRANTCFLREHLRRRYRFRKRRLSRTSLSWATPGGYRVAMTSYGSCRLGDQAAALPTGPLLGWDGLE